MIHAVNICDLLILSVHDTILHMLIAQYVDQSRIVEAETGKVAGIGHAAILVCPEEQAAAIIEVARHKYRKHELRFYESKTGNGGWKRV